MAGFNGTETRNWGPVKQIQCSRCQQVTVYELYDVCESLVNVLPIPIPIKTQYLLKCPLCGQSQEIEASVFESYKPLALLNRAKLDGRMPKEEYEHLVELYKQEKYQEMDLAMEQYKRKKNDGMMW